MSKNCYVKMKILIKQNYLLVNADTLIKTNFNVIIIFLIKIYNLKRDRSKVIWFKRYQRHCNAIEITIFRISTNLMILLN